MDLQFRDAQLVRRLIDGLKALVTDVNLEISPERGLELNEMDSTHISLVRAQLGPACFSALRTNGAPVAEGKADTAATAAASGPRCVVVGVSLVVLARLFQSDATSNCRMRWRMERADAADLAITCEPAEGKRRRTTRFRVKTTSIERDRLQPPDTAYEFRVFVRSALFQRLIKDMAALTAESITVEIFPDRVSFSAATDDGTSAFDFPNVRQPDMTEAGFACLQSAAAVENPDAAFLFAPTPAPGAALAGEAAPGEAGPPASGKAGDAEEPMLRMRFVTKHLLLFTRCSSLSPHVEVSFHQDLPMLVRYPLYGGPLPPEPDPERDPDSAESAPHKLEPDAGDPAAPLQSDKKESKSASAGGGAKKPAPVKGVVKGPAKAAVKGAGGGSTAGQPRLTDFLGTKRKKAPGAEPAATGVRPRLHEQIGAIDFYLAPKIDDA
jgi:Proliferating cell nuclear antigen, N-terminal domain